MKDFVSKKAKNIKPSGIRKFFDIVSERKDVISLGVGEPDFITPWEIRDAGIQAIKKVIRSILLTRVCLLCVKKFLVIY